MVALYCRTSTDKQTKGLEAQERALIEYCNSNDISDYTIYKDEGISGAKSNRPELNKLMDDVRNGIVKKVIVYSFSRFARSTRHLLDALEEFSKLNIEFTSLSESLDTSSAIGRALFTIISSISQLERELVAERVRNGLANARAKGKILGRPISRKSELIRELRNQKYTYEKIAKLAGCSIATVSRELSGFFQKAG